MRMLRFAVPIALIALAAWPSAAQPASVFETQRPRFHGTWRLVMSAEEGRRVVERAITQTVDAMNFFVRGLARDQLRSNTPINRRIDLFFEAGERIQVRFDDRYEYTTRLGRTQRVTTPEGNAMRVTQRFRDGALEQVFETDAGTRWNVYTVLADGRMRVSATTQGMMMPQPMHFTLDYERVR